MADSKESVIAAYIRRFREQPPTKPEERGHAAPKEFWWIDRSKDVSDINEANAVLVGEKREQENLDETVVSSLDNSLRTENLDGSMISADVFPRPIDNVPVMQREPPVPVDSAARFSHYSERSSERGSIQSPPPSPPIERKSTIFPSQHASPDAIASRHRSFSGERHPEPPAIHAKHSEDTLAHTSAVDDLLESPAYRIPDIELSIPEIELPELEMDLGDVDDRAEQLLLKCDAVLSAIRRRSAASSTSLKINIPQTYPVENADRNPPGRIEVTDNSVKESAVRKESVVRSAEQRSESHVIDASLHGANAVPSGSVRAEDSSPVAPPVSLSAQSPKRAGSDDKRGKHRRRRIPVDSPASTAPLDVSSLGSPGLNYSNSDASGVFMFMSTSSSGRDIDDAEKPAEDADDACSDVLRRADAIQRRFNFPVAKESAVSRTSSQNESVMQKHTPRVNDSSDQDGPISVTRDEMVQDGGEQTQSSHMMSSSKPVIEGVDIDSCPINSEFIEPYLGDEIVELLWRKLLAVRSEMHRRAQQMS
jgi:hypothetical protein